MKKTIAAGFICLLSIYRISPAWASDALDAARVEKTVGAYEQAWKEPHAEKRDALIAEAWSKKGVFKDPGGAVTGRSALSKLIGKFHEDFPNTVADRTSKIDFYGRSFRFSWRMVFARDGRVLEGVDFGELDADGRIASITGFWQPLPNLSTTANQAIVVSYLDALFRTRDLSVIDKLVAPGAVYTQAVGLPYGGVFVGFKEWTGMFIKSTTFFDVIGVTQPSLATNDSGDRIVASFDVRFRSKATGKESLQPIQEQFILKDGRIVALTPSYFDTKSLLDTLQ
jgi:ketosteroid isomerase-like protein